MVEMRKVRDFTLGKSAHPDELFRCRWTTDRLKEVLQAAGHEEPDPPKVILPDVGEGMRLVVPRVKRRALGHALHLAVDFGTALTVKHVQHLFALVVRMPAHTATWRYGLVPIENLWTDWILRGDTITLVWPLAIMGEKRLEAIPDVPTFKDRNIDLVFNVWRGIAVAKSTSPEVVNKLREVATKVSADPRFRETLAKQNLTFAFADGPELKTIMAPSTINS